MTKMRFGIQTSLNNVEWREIEDMWKFLDRETKFHSAWTFDHFVPPGPGQDANANCFEGWTALASLAAVTERIRLGCLVTGVTYRHPSVLAKMAATVDHISNGRLSFGIGAAWHEPEHRMYGIDFSPVKERQDRLEEAVHLTKLLFEAEGRVNFEGTYYQLRDAVFVPRCVQKPHPPIMVGGGGEKRTLRTLALYGDVMNVFGTPDVVRKKIAAMEAHCRAVGRDPAEIQRTISATVVVTDNQGLIDRLVGMFGPGQGLTPDEAKKQLPIGPPAHVRSVVERYAEAGVSGIIMQTQGPWKREIYQRINDEVVAAFV
ncbi:MAG: TIGR03560 family F420-dependent LLM class oxidoreductase [Dehalococcoidia bacterium]|nr:MAG: TIGR03560 family F420-dependent LLM class oxidoreductase [Dehalococcoidia bacterium]